MTPQACAPMARHKRQPLQPTAAQMAAAARQLAKAGRFATLDEALAHPHWARFVRCTAMAIAERERRRLVADPAPLRRPDDMAQPLDRRPVMAPRAPREHRTAGVARAQRQMFDARRAAANDLDDAKDTDDGH